MLIPVVSTNTILPPPRPMACQEFVFWIGGGAREGRKKEMNLCYILAIS